MAKRHEKLEGRVYRRADGSWCAQVTLRDGRRKSKYGKSQQEGNAWPLSLREAVRANAWVSDESLTLSRLDT